MVVSAVVMVASAVVMVDLEDHMDLVHMDLAHTDLAHTDLVHMDRQDFMALVTDMDMVMVVVMVVVMVMVIDVGMGMEVVGLFFVIVAFFKIIKFIERLLL